MRAIFPKELYSLFPPHFGSRCKQIHTILLIHKYKLCNSLLQGNFVESARLDLGQKGEVCIDRREAISLAVNKANAGDVVLIMGKGHESGQEINGVITPFDDRLELTQAILKQGNK